VKPVILYILISGGLGGKVGSREAWEGRLGLGRPGREVWVSGGLGGKVGSACEEFENGEGGVLGHCF